MKIIAGKKIYSVWEINAIARRALETMTFWVEGEISSFRGANTHYRYLYFDLKDPQTGYKLPCICEPSILEDINFEFIEGKQVLILGHLTLWEKDGRYQMYVHQIELFGEGMLLAQFELLKSKLQQKGYFDVKFKKPIPSYPTNIAVITSKISDAWYDFKTHTYDKFPIIKITLFDVMVQGEKSPSLIIGALKRAETGNFDCIVLIRGGGSLEDIAAFNDEKLAQTIFEAKSPIVVGVGHEKDVTIAQLVADIGASTPTDAAKIITSNFTTLEMKLTTSRERLRNAIVSYLLRTSQRVDLIFERLANYTQRYKQLPSHLKFLGQSLSAAKQSHIIQNQKRLDGFYKSLKDYWKFIVRKEQERLGTMSQTLRLLSPQNILARGYSITYDFKNKVIKNVKDIALGSKVKVKLAKGSFLSKVYQKNI